MQTDMITTLVFDIGNVLSHFCFDVIANEASRRTSMSARSVREVFVRWSQPFCIGDMEATAFAEHCLEDLQFTGSAEDLKRAYNAGFTSNKAMNPVIERCAADYRLLYLSDTNPWHLEHLLEHEPLLSRFEGGTASFSAQALKPKAAIYEYAMQEHGFSASEAIFIDDRMPNVKGAEAVGFTGLHYDLNHHATFEAQLAEHLG